jgi:hypothetical protein
MNSWRRRAHVPDVGEKANAREPFGLGEPLLGGEGMQMPDQSGHQRSQPRIGTVVHPVDDLLRQRSRGLVVGRHVVAHSYPT